MKLDTCNWLPLRWKALVGSFSTICYALMIMCLHLIYQSACVCVLYRDEGTRERTREISCWILIAYEGLRYLLSPTVIRWDGNWNKEKPALAWNNYFSAKIYINYQTIDVELIYSCCVTKLPCNRVVLGWRVWRHCVMQLNLFYDLIVFCMFMFVGYTGTFAQV